MDNLAALRANISDAHGVVLTENHFVKALVDEGLVADAIYSAADERAIDLATIRLYDKLLAGGSLTEGHLSYSIDMNSVRVAKESLQDKLGIERDAKNKVDTASRW